MLQGIPGECVATVVVDGLDGREGEEPHGLAIGHAGNKKSNTCTSSIQEKSFNRMIVQGTEGIGYIETVMAGMEGHCRMSGMGRSSTAMLNIP